MLNILYWAALVTRNYPIQSVNSVGVEKLSSRTIGTTLIHKKYSVNHLGLFDLSKSTLITNTNFLFFLANFYIIIKYNKYTTCT